MKGFFWLFILSWLIPTGLLSAAEKQLSLSEVPAIVARGQVAALGNLADTNQLRLALSLPLRDPAGLNNLLAAIYTPGNPQYHHYLTPAEFAERFGATTNDYAILSHFAQSHGLSVVATHPNRLVLDVAGRVADIESAFRVKLRLYQHPGEARRFYAPDSAPTVDAALPLLHISGLDDFAPRHPNSLFQFGAAPEKKSPNGGSSPMGTYLGNDFRQAYLPGTQLTGAGQSVALVEYDGYRPDDITNYANLIGLTNNAPAVTTIPVNGGIANPGANITEVTLDIEMILAMAPGVSNVFVYEAPNPTPWVDMMSQIANDNLAAQVSCSWSGGSPDPAAEQVFQQMAAQGQSVFNASGDTGAYTNVIPFPCASPNITQVGGTYLATDTNGNYVAEAVWNRGNGVADGGGVGLTVEMPAWQMGIDMTTNGGSSVWRNVPDVALTAEDIYIIVNGQGGTAAGTSCAAPLWAGVAALINQQTVASGQPLIGFINPAVYGLCRGTNYPALFHDIVSGNNTNWVSQTNFSAWPGYDLCTGWGTPAGTNLINALAAPDPLGILLQTNLSSHGMVGGPLSDTNWLITLTNSGARPLTWSLGAPLPAWLTVTPTRGVLCPQSSTNVSVSLLNPNALPAGGYVTALMFTNQNQSRIQNVLVRVEIGQSIVQNGGFETGDFSGWTLVGDTVTMHQVCNVVATDADYQGLVHSGNFGAFLGQRGYAATLSQLLPTTPGQSYLVSFWLDNLMSDNFQQFSAFWSGTNLVTLTSPPSFTWSNLLFMVTAADTNATLEFDAENDPFYFGFDDVSVLPIPPLTFSSYSVTTNGFELAWPSIAGLNYVVQYSPDLTQDVWSDLGTVQAITNLSTFVDPAYLPDSPQGFYRLSVPP